ncbi:MAG: hypothetical protein HZB53_00350 [Chloroflexi bacterium]|nr:hypothetical protein [Chloroflexota bacterium]
MPRPSLKVGTAWNLVVIGSALVSYWAITALIVARAMDATGGRLVYPLDDTYTHMAIARHAAENGVWGVTVHEFSSSSSSPLWVFLLFGIYRVAGTGDVWPLALNLVFGTSLLVSVGWALGHSCPVVGRAVTLGAVLLAVPLPLLTFEAMEHVLHAFLLLLFVYLVSGRLVSDAMPEFKTDIAILVIAALSSAARYESLFAIGIAVVLLVARGRWRYAMALAASAVTLIGIYGLWSVSNGWPLLPTSALLKGYRPELSITGISTTLLGSRALINLANNPVAWTVLLAGIIVLVCSRHPRPWKRGRYALVLACGTVILHAEFAILGWFFRYEAYLVCLVIIGIALVLREEPRLAFSFPATRQARLRAGIIMAVVLVLSVPFGYRVRNALRDGPPASREIYQQQWQMSAFLDEYYRDQTVAINDIGVIGYRTPVKYIDLFGLASRDVALLKLAERYDRQNMAEIVAREHVSVALIYDPWFASLNSGGTVLGWARVGQWRLPTQVVVGNSTVSIYAVDPTRRQELVRNLRAFMFRLPPEVAQSGEYTLASSN